MRNGPTPEDYDADTGQRVETDDPTRSAPLIWLRMALVGVAMLYAALACPLLTLGRWIWPGRKP